LWPGRKAVYYGLTKEEWLARKSAKWSFILPSQQSNSYFDLSLQRIT
jgi:hypothetical protein